MLYNIEWNEKLFLRTRLITYVKYCFSIKQLKYYVIVTFLKNLFVVDFGFQYWFLFLHIFTILYDFNLFYGLLFVGFVCRCVSFIISWYEKFNFKFPWKCMSKIMYPPEFFYSYFSIQKQNIRRQRNELKLLLTTKYNQKGSKFPMKFHRKAVETHASISMAWLFHHLL